MRTTTRLLTGSALAVAAAGLLCAPAYAGDTDGLAVFPSSVVPGGQVSVSTAACGDGSTAAAGDASAVGAGAFTMAPGTQDGDATGQFRVPSSAQPGTYEIAATCAEGGRRVTGDLVVTLTSQRQPAVVHPRGSVKTGVGGALGPDPVQTAAGVAALAVAAAGGTWLLHRRARGDGI
ncbi:type IV secretory pathway TrbL component [Streptomyces canus]